MGMVSRLLVVFLFSFSFIVSSGLDCAAQSKCHTERQALRQARKTFRFERRTFKKKVRLLRKVERKIARLERVIDRLEISESKRSLNRANPEG